MPVPYRLLRVCLPVLPLLLACAAAWGRAGGGDQYSGGGSSSYGDSSSDGGDFFFNLLLALVFEYPAIGVPLLVIVVIVVLVSNNQVRRGAPLASEPRMTRVVASQVRSQGDSRIDTALGAIKARDAAFDPQAFLGRAKAAFLKIQQAWSAQDMRPARPFISDGVMERFSIQLEMQQAQGLRNQMSAVNVLDARIVEAESDTHFDTLHVCLTASAVDTMVTLADGKPVGGGPGGAQTFTEVWSFLRRPGAQSLQRQGPIDGFCPSCGAPLAISDAAQCGSCKSWINSGQYDWVLCEITQQSAWAVRGSGESVPGFRELAQRDPGLNTQFLEDRASVAFWRWQRALTQDNSKALLPVATPAFCQAWGADALARQYRCRNVAVGAVEVRALEAGEEMNLAHVAVRWSGQSYTEHLPQLRELIFVLGRRRDARTDPDAGLSSCRCPNCGAPPSSRDVATCEYCATPFNDGSRNWVVTQIVPISAWHRPGPQMPPGAAEVPKAPVAGPFATPGLGWVQHLSSSEVLAVLVSAMMADGAVDPAERKMLDQYARNNHIDPASIDGLIEAARQGHLEIPQPRTPQEASACLNGLIEMSLADGRVDPAELKLILAYAERAGIDRGTVTQRIKQRRLELYRQADA